MEIKFDESLLVDGTEDIDLTDEELDRWQKQIDIADEETSTEVVSFKITVEQRGLLEQVCKQFNIPVQDYLYKMFIREIFKDYGSLNPSNKQNVS